MKDKIPKWKARCPIRSGCPSESQVVEVKPDSRAKPSPERKLRPGGKLSIRVCRSSLSSLSVEEEERNEALPR